MSPALLLPHSHLVTQEGGRQRPESIESQEAPGQVQELELLSGHIHVQLGGRERRQGWS